LPPGESHSNVAKGAPLEWATYSETAPGYFWKSVSGETASIEEISTRAFFKR